MFNLKNYLGEQIKLINKYIIDNSDPIKDATQEAKRLTKEWIDRYAEDFNKNYKE